MPAEFGKALGFYEDSLPMPRGLHRHRVTVGERGLVLVCTMFRQSAKVAGISRISSQLQRGVVQLRGGFFVFSTHHQRFRFVQRCGIKREATEKRERDW